MTKVAVIHNVDNTISIMHFAPEMFDPNSKTRASLPELDNKSDDEIIQWIINKDMPLNSIYTLLDEEGLPENKVFRDAWTIEGQIIKINLLKAKEIKLNQFRELRAPLLKKLDVDYMRADELGDQNKKLAIVQQKQILRDITAIELPDDVDSLASFIPAALLGE